METSEVTINDFFEILKRRKWSLLLPSFIVFLAVGVMALTLPPIYKSTAKILIEEQEIPTDFVKATVTSYAEQRLQTINQRVMTSSRLLEIINRFSLYQDLREKGMNEEIVGKMREDTKLEPISAEVTDRRTKIIAFTLSYEGKDAPETIQQVAGVLTSLFLEENLQVRKRQTLETSQFLENEMEKVKADLAEIEGKVASFKEVYINELPELFQVNTQSLNTIEGKTERVEEQL
ncbi:MAG: chain-length determining protein, partial [Deltaproteobacteria bacterium]|nr:chain-length determining protein [Deltaproteobacteria bacterium]